MNKFKKGDTVYLNNPGYSTKEYGYQVETSGKYKIVGLTDSTVLSGMGFEALTYLIIRVRKNSKHVFEVNREWLEERANKIV